MQAAYGTPHFLAGSSACAPFKLFGPLILQAFSFEHFVLNLA